MLCLVLSAGGVDCGANPGATCRSQESEFNGLRKKLAVRPLSGLATACTCNTDPTTGTGPEHSVCNDAPKNTTAVDAAKHYNHACSKNDGSDGVVCAANTDYGYTFDDTTGEKVAFRNTIVYGDNSSRWNGTTVLFRSHARDKGPYCEVSVNGEECKECLPTVCDGTDNREKTTVGFRIACGGGATSGDGRYYSFDSCSDTPDDSRSKNGYLEIFHGPVLRLRQPGLCCHHYYYYWAATAD